MPLRPWIGTEPVRTEQADKQYDALSKFYRKAHGGRLGPPVGEMWEVLALCLQVNTSAAAGNRRPYLALLGGGFTTPNPNVYVLSTYYEIGPSEQGTYSWSVGGGDQPTVVGAAAYPWEAHSLPEVPVDATMGFQVNVVAEDAADDWTLNVYGYRHYYNR